MTASTRPTKPARARGAADARRPVARFRMRVARGDVVSVGPGKIALLEAIDETRSITAAARSLGMSYRRAWVLVDEMNAALRQPAVASSAGGEHGGGSMLTDAGRELVAIYRRIEATAERAARTDIERLLALLA